nr:ribonuclease H-like domain-containing protein [Tanacetum cinerariifolium]
MNTMPYERSQNLEIPMKSLKMVQPQVQQVMERREELLQSLHKTCKRGGMMLRLQAIVSHLEFMDVEIEQDDLNQKLLTSLAPEWLMHTIVWRNKSDLDTMSLDDLYNHLKVYEPEVQKKLESNSQKMTFISLAKNNSGNGELTLLVFPLPALKFPLLVLMLPLPVSVLTLLVLIVLLNLIVLILKEDWEKDLHTRAPRSQERGRKENYKQGTKEEEQAPKALMVIDGVGWDWSYMENKEENHALVADEEAPTEFALMAKSSTDNEVFDNSLCFKACKKNTDSLNSKITELTEKLGDTKNMLYHYKLVYSPPKKDMSWTGLPEFANNIITDYTMPFLSVESNPNDLQNNSSSVFEIGESNGSILSKPEIKFVKAVDSLTVVKANKDETVRKTSVKYAKMYRKTTKRSNVKGNQRNWNNLKSQQLRKNFLMKKACYNCGCFDHLSYDCGKWVDQGRTW